MYEKSMVMYAGARLCQSTISVILGYSWHADGRCDGRDCIDLKWEPVKYFMGVGHSDQILSHNAVVETYTEGHCLVSSIDVILVNDDLCNVSNRESIALSSVYGDLCQRLSGVIETNLWSSVNPER
ncbi:hypothetical protein VNO77_30338 [Canavalia gladiata]|uniref:Uncharacterized protein n=1 Tax=Canavalia gladiata TaxID=3824 RepID=A0AAN9Q753_CANGL